MKNAFKHLKNPTVIVAVAGILLLGVVAMLSYSRSLPQEVVEVSLATVQEETSATGIVKPATAVNLSFKNSGKVSLVRKILGEQVVAGEVIAKLDSSVLSAQRIQATYYLQQQQTKLTELRNQTKPLELLQIQKEIVAHEADMKTAQQVLLSTIKTSYATTSSAMYLYVDRLFINPTSLTPQIRFQTDPNIALTIQSGRVEVEKRLGDLDRIAREVSTSTLLSMSESAKYDLAEAKLFLDTLSFVVNTLPASTNQVSTTTLAEWVQDLSLARNQVNGTLSAILVTQEKIKQLQSSLLELQTKLATAQTGTSTQAIQAQAVVVAQAQASLQSIDKKIDQSSIVSPITGVLTRQDVRIGQSVIADTAVATIANNNQFDIETYIPKADIAKVKIGQEATIRFAEYGTSTALQAIVVAIDSKESHVDNQTSYRVILKFSNRDERIQTGMNALITIKGDRKEPVIAIPEQAVFTRGGKKYVSLKEGEQIEIREIKIGLEGSDGLLEITEGLEQGDVVVVGR